MCDRFRWNSGGYLNCCELMDKVNLDQKFALFSQYFQPKIVGELNGQHVKLVKVLGPFVWHHHNG